ncbi:hypothetical protein [Paenibacillus pedocola]|uniref:hypothetical protein n=1 Tax=Paenibacillus pedocola TaxID=3242193 RepID=UPI002877D242|nr:hypothetical protein [Paenibacillus typhae]
MVAQLIWIVAVYASAVVLIHILHHREHTRRVMRSGKRIHYFLITRNHEAVIEGYIRMLAFHAFWTGILYQVTVLDDESKDGTLAVATKLAYSGSAIDIAPLMHFRSVAGEDEYQREIVIDLRMPGSGGSQSRRGEC